MTTEKYVAVPMSTALYEALKQRATANGRTVGREVAQLAKRIIKGAAK